jgi:hypothetical protein
MRITTFAAARQYIPAPRRSPRTAQEYVNRQARQGDTKDAKTK